MAAGEEAPHQCHRWIIATLRFIADRICSAARCLVLKVHTTINFMTSVDVPAYGPVLPLAKDEEEREPYHVMKMDMQAEQKPVIDYANRVMKRLGATQEMSRSHRDVLMEMPNIFHAIVQSQPGLPTFRFELKHQVYWVACRCKNTIRLFEFPPWWSIVRDNYDVPMTTPGRRKVVFVTQGTLHSYDDLMFPTIKALSSQNDFIVIGALGRKCASLPLDFGIPSNTRIIDYIPYDMILPVVDVMVSNAGFGSYRQGIMNGFPMVLAVVRTDLAEVSARAEWCGVGINLRTGKPSAQAIAGTIADFLRTPSYMRRTVELRENEELDSLAAVEQLILHHTESVAWISKNQKSLNFAPFSTNDKDMDYRGKTKL